MTFIFLYSIHHECYAEPMFSTDIVKNSQEISDNTAFKLTLNDVENKFENLNIKSSYDDLNKLLAKPCKNDFYLLVLADFDALSLTLTNDPETIKKFKYKVSSNENRFK